MAESRFTSAGVYIEVEGQLVRVTSAGGYVEVQAVLQRQTAAGLYVEIVRAQARATAAGLYVEIGYPRRPRAHYEYDGVDLTNYINTADMEIAPRELRKGTLGDTAGRYKVGPSASLVRLKGDWNPTIDAILGRDAFAKNWRTGAVWFDDGVRRIRYEWKDRAQVIEWRVLSPANGKQEFNAVLRHNGLGVRSVIID